MITPPATLGVLGGGQLGRYFVMAARTMGYRTIVLEPDPHSPAGKVADKHLIAAFDDESALQHLATSCAVVTTEFENPPAAAMESLARHTLVRPSPAAVAITQDRRSEKAFLARAGFAIAPYRVIETDSDVEAAGRHTYPSILKTARLGYDGKGQIVVAAHDRLAEAWQALRHEPCVLEQRLDLDREVSVILARSTSGQTVVYPVAVNSHVNGILDCTVAPHVAPGATELAEEIAAALDYAGVLAVEMFVINGALLVNELAPRPHNSGHWTLDAARTSQFEQQVRAICGVGLGDTSMRSPAVAMVNLLGDLWAGGEPDWSAALAEPQASLHLYGKQAPRPGRKMGHLTVTSSTPADAERLARAIRRSLTAG